MNDIRIPIPWEDFRDPEGQIRLCRMEDERAMYNAIVNYLTRPITHEDIRSCLRMPEDWTDEQIDEFKDYIMEWTTSHLHSNSVAGRALEIATRPAPKLDLWYEMDKALDDHVTNGIVWKSWVELKKSEGK